VSEEDGENPYCASLSGKAIDRANRTEQNMSEAWLYQVRMSVSAELSARLRGDAGIASHAALHDVLQRHDATVKCQFDAFADYVNEAEQFDPDNYPLYEWTRQTIENPAKKAKYLQSFTVYVDGEEIYAGDIAEALRTELAALVGRDGIESVVKIDTNPANNPQPPARG
jgi:hypothetical protein